MIIKSDDVIFSERLNGGVIESNLRDHSGLSAIGSPCMRQLQYAHYWAYKQQISNRIGRLFGVGHRMEDTMIADLAEVGVIVTDQQVEIIGTGGHWKGHIDGLAAIHEIRHLIEFKTHNEKSFNDMSKKKVKLSKPTHYAQMQAYMGYLKISKALYMAYNKNTSEYYFEFVDFDEEYFNELKRKEAEVLFSEVLLKRIGNNNQTWFECKFCDARHVCFGKQEINISCRSCQHVDVMDEGKWHCTKLEQDLSPYTQKEACQMYELSDMFKE